MKDRKADKLYTVAELARLLRIDRSTLTRRIKANNLPANISVESRRPGPNGKILLTYEPTR